MSDPNTRRYIQWYDKTTELAVGDEDLKGMELQFLQKLFNVSGENPMYDCWEVKQEHLEILQKYVSHSIDLNKFDYFVEVSAI